MEKYDKLNLMVPTYGRAGTSLPIFVDSAEDTVSDPSKICFCFCVNAEDKATLDYLKGRTFRSEMEIILENTATPNLAVYFNLMYNHTKSKEESTLVSMLGDDMIFQTKGWDVEVLNLVNAYKGVGVFWCNDNYIAREKMCVNMFATRMFVEATEEPFMCEKFPGDMIDYLWYKVGQYTKSLHFLPNVIIRHEHNTRKPKEEWDSTFKRLVPAQATAHAEYGKAHAKTTAARIADRLLKKGMKGDNQ